MPTKCLITGLIVTPDGNPILSQKVYFVSRKVRPITPLTIVPEHAIGETDAQGMISIELYPGLYTGQVMICLKQKYPTFDLTVPEAPTATLADILDLPAPPSMTGMDLAVAAAQRLRDEAVQAAADAEAAVGEAGTGGAVATAQAVIATQAAVLAAEDALAAAEAAAAAEASKNAVDLGALDEAKAQTEVDRLAAAGSAAAASTAAGTAAGAAATAGTAKTAAETARDAAIAAGVVVGTYASTAAGVAAVAEGAKFWAPSSDSLSLQQYTKTGGAAVAVAGNAMPTATVASAVAQRKRIGSLIGDTGFAASELVGPILASTWAAFLTGYSISAGELSVGGAGYPSTPVLYGAGHRRAADTAVVVTMEVTISSIAASNVGPRIGFGDSAAGYVGVAWGRNAAVGTETAGAVAISQRSLGQMGASIAAGDRCRMTVEVRKDGAGIMTCENLTQVKKFRKEISGIPAGAIWAAWARNDTGVVHAFSVSRVSVIPSDVPLPDYQRASFPNMLKSVGAGGLVGALLSGTAVASEIVIGKRSMLQALTTTGGGGVEFNIALPPDQTRASLSFWLESIEAAASQPQIYLMQFTDEDGSGYTSATEVLAKRIAYSLGTAAITDRRLYAQYVDIDPTARRLVFRLTNNSAANIVRLSEMMLVFDDDMTFRPPAGVGAAIEAQFETLSSGIATQVAQTSLLTNRVAAVEGAEIARPPLLADVNHVLVSGQSLGVGVGATGALTTVQPYDNLMPANGEHDFSADTQGMTGAPTSTSLVPLVYSKIGETVGIGGLNLAKKLLIDEIGANAHQMLLSNNARGGYSISGLIQGTDFYNWGLAQAALYKSLANAAGKTFAQQAIWWLQGESDASANATIAAYKAALKKLIDDWNTDLPQIRKVPMLTYQMASHTVRSGGVPPNVAIAQLEASREHDDIYLVTPMYHVPYNGDYVHLPNHSSRWIGQYFAKVHHQVCQLGKTWRPLEPIAVRQQGQLIDIDFHVPVGPLVLDTTLVTNPGNFGFLVKTVAAGTVKTISSVALRGSSGIRIVLAADPAEQVRVQYAHGEAGWATGPTAGARGNLRDSDPTVAIYNDAGGNPYKLFNWCVIFDEVCSSF